MSNSAGSTIRIASCRSDGRCPECGGGILAVLKQAPCGCWVCLHCTSIHFAALLTEALRQRDGQQERGDQAESARATQLAESIEVLQRVEEERDAAISKVAADKRLLGECLAVLVALPGNVKSDQVPALCGKIWKVLNG